MTDEKTITVKLNVKDRMTIKAIIRRKKSEDIDQILECRRQAKQFDLTDKEKEIVSYKEANGQADYDETKDFEVEMTFPVHVARMYIEQTQELAKQKLISANTDDALDAYEKVQTALAAAK